jgi:hypothetical protein
MLSEEERTDLKIVQRLFSLFLYLIFLSTSSLSQIPINGFINFKDIETVSKQSRLFSLNFNKDSYSDLLIYNNDNKVAFLLEGKPNLNFSKPLKLFFRYEPNFLKPIFNQSNQLTAYAFTSRKSKVFSLMNFSKFGYPGFTKTIKFKSFPNRIDYADIDLDNSNDYLISGEAFEGLSIIAEKNNQLIERKLFQKNVFLDAFFFDINWDEYVDILAYDLIGQKLKFIYNKDGERFISERELEVNHQISKIQITDLNIDGYRDLIFATEFGLLIYYGDNLNTFSTQQRINSSSKISNFTVGDYNHDGNFDFFCYSSERNYLSIFFGKSDGEFYEELIVDIDKEVNDLIPFFSKFVYGVACLNSDGKIRFISEFSSVKGEVNFIYGLNPTAIKTFDLTNNGLLDFIFIDRFDNKLKFIIRDNQGIPSIYFHTNLKGSHTEIFLLKKSATNISVYCYSKNERMIENIDVDFGSYNQGRNIIYVDGKIQDLWAVNINGVGEIKILYSKENMLNYGVLKLSVDRKYKSIKYPSVSDKFLSANILSEYEDKILVWESQDSLINLKLVNYVFNLKQDLTVYSSKLNEVNNFFNCIKKQNQSYNYLASLVQTSEKKYLFIFDQRLKKLSDTDYLSGFTLLDKKPLVSDTDGFIYFYDVNSRSFYLIIFVISSNRIFFRNVFDGINAEDFLIAKLDKSNKHLVYIDSTQQKIRLRQFN